MRTRRKRGEEGGSSQGGMRHLGVAVSMIRGPSLFRCRIISKGLGSSFRQLEYTHWKSPFGQIQSFVTFLLSHRHISVAKRRKLCRTCGRTARQSAGFGSAFGFTPFGNRALQHKMNNIWVKNTRNQQLVGNAGSSCAMAAYISCRQMRMIYQDACVHATRDMLYFRALR